MYHKYRAKLKQIVRVKKIFCSEPRHCGLDPQSPQSKGDAESSSAWRRFDICTLKVATVLVKLEDIDSYIIIVADTIYHNIQEGVLEMEAGVAKVYKMNSDVLEPSVAHLKVNRIKLWFVANV